MRRHIIEPSTSPAPFLVVGSSILPRAATANDNSIAGSYFEHLMAWLVRTGQVGEASAEGAPPSVYWTNDVAL